MNYRNAQRLKNGAVDCEIDHPSLGWIPFTCAPTDAGASFDVAALYAALDADPKTAPYVAPTEAEVDAAAAAAVRVERDSLLRSFVDPVVSNPLRWKELKASKRKEWSDYRSALLNITKSEEFPHRVVWPSTPE